MKSLEEEILRMNGESFDEGARAAFESLLETLEVVYLKNPTLSFAEIILLIKEIVRNSKLNKELT
jgi:hypothetical protein